MTSRKKPHKKRSQVPFYVGGGILALLLIAFITTGLGGADDANGTSAAQETLSRTLPNRESPTPPSAWSCPRFEDRISTEPPWPSPTTAGPRRSCFSLIGDRSASPRSRTTPSTWKPISSRTTSTSTRSRPASTRVEIITHRLPGWSARAGPFRRSSTTPPNRPAGRSVCVDNLLSVFSQMS